MEKDIDCCLVKEGNECIIRLGRTPSPSTLFRGSLFLKDELAVRIAHRAIQLDNLPYGLAEVPGVLEVRNWYVKSFQELSEMPSPEIPQFLKDKYKSEEATAKEQLTPSGSRKYFYYWPFAEEDEKHLPTDYQKFNRDFALNINHIKKRHDPVAITLAHGIREWKAKNPNLIFNETIQNFINRFHLSRVGIRVLIGQHLALSNPLPDPNYVGFICTKTNILQSVQDAVNNARFVCDDYYGYSCAPNVSIHFQNNVNFVYMPSHLHHMCFELIKNSLRAVIEYHKERVESGLLKTYPEIKVIIADGQEDITVKISDEGGGIPRSALPLVWTYMYTTAKQDFQSTEDDYKKTDFRAPLAGFGYGLPLSRVYANYFGGDLKLISMEGYGTDAYLHLRRLSDGEEPLPV